ncbi:MAG: peptidase, partial [Gammaproteobacteria bacterium]
FDELKPLGARETGGRAALPVWIEYMREALKDKPDHLIPEPPGMVRVRIDPENGEATQADDPKGVFEIFRAGTEPQPPAVASGGGSQSGSGSTPAVDATSPGTGLF